MVTLERIRCEIIQCESFGFQNDFVALAVKISEEGEATHAGIVLGYNGNIFLLHYTSVEVKISSIPNKWYFQKHFDLIKEPIVPAFFTYCKKIVEKANPEYAYFFAGAIYDQNTGFFSTKELPELMTCVGFCISVILGFIEADEYFMYSDWTAETLENTSKYIQHYTKEFSTNYPQFDLDLLLANVRRIKPSEFLASAFIEYLPIRKDAIDQILDKVETALLEKYKSVA